MNKNYYGTNNSSNCGNPCPPPGPCPQDSYIVGNSVDFTINNCDSEIKADVVVSNRESVRVWGQIKDCSGKQVSYAYLKLIKVTSDGYVGVAHTITDCLGFYQFDICPCTDGTNFRLLVGKAATEGSERVISSGLDGTNCNPCIDAPNCDCR